MTQPLSTAHEADQSTSLSRRSPPLLLAALIPLAVLAAPVFADDAGTPAPPAGTSEGTGRYQGSELQEVVVTAEKRQATVQETPISLTALSDVQLERQNIATLEDLAGSVPGISMRTAGPGQTEYEMRGLTSAGGSTATVGFYLDETPLSANAVALNGRTVIDPDLFDLNHVEVLRGPQGTLYGAGSMGGTIKLVTNQPQLGKWEAATDLNTSHTDSGGSWNGGGSVMLNIPLGDIVALRVVGTDKYVSGWLDRYIYGASFPFPTNPSGTPLALPGCLEYYCKRGDLTGLTPEQVVDGVNLERFSSARAMLLVKPSDKLSVTTTLMYQRIDTDGYNTYQATGDSPEPYPSTPGVYQPYDQPEPYTDQFKLASLDLVYDFGPATLTFAPAYFQRWVIQSQDSTEPLQNINNLTEFLQSLYQEGDLTTQDSLELRLASNGNGRLQWQGGIFGADLHSTYNGYEQTPAYATALSCGYPSLANPVGGHCPASEQFNPNSVLSYPDASLPPYPSPEAANPEGVIFNDHNPNVMKQEAIFGEASYKLLDDLKLTAGIRFFRFTIDNHAEQAGLGTASGNQDPTIQNSSSNGSAVLPKLNLSYTPTPDLTLYGTISKGSRPGGVNLPIPLPTIQELEANPAAYNCNVPLANQLNPSLPVPPGSYVSKEPTFGPDSVWSYELGEKWRFFDRRFTINGDIYYIKWTDIQQVVSLTCGYPADINAGNAQAYGPEIETSTRITDALTFDLSYAYTHAVINDPNPAAEASGFYPGIRVINVPKYTAIASLDYQRPFTDKLAGVFHLTSSLVGPILDQAYYREELASHNLIDARAGVTGGQWAAYLTGTNLTNKLAQLTIDNTVFAWQQPTLTRVSTNQPRTIGVDFQYRF
jgi:iron complex outermembrane recepter protein